MRTIDELVRSLNVEDDTEISHAIEALRPHGDAAFAALRPALRSSSIRQRRGAALALGRLGARVAAPDLVEACSDPAMSVRRNATLALAVIFDGQDVPPDVVGALLARVDDDSGGVRVVAIGATARLGLRAATARLIAALEDEKWYLRQAAATALGELGAYDASAALRARSSDPRLAVRTAVADALSRLEDVRRHPPAGGSSRPE